MSVKQPTEVLAREFQSLFSGLDRAYGRYDVRDTSDVKKTGRAVTVKETLTLDRWVLHLEGREGLGVIPINDDNECNWGVIDVDTYDVDLPMLSRQLEDTPFVLCRSKSGGPHIFLFTQQPVPAKLMQYKLKAASALLGYGGSEVFPKQTELLTERGDVGQWLNMPYFGGESTTRYAIRNGERVPFVDFVEYARSRALPDEQALKKFTLAPSDLGKNNPIVDGPPCLQILTKMGFPEGTRNQGLYNVGVFYKKANPDEWKTLLEKYNHTFMRPPLSSTEVQTVAKSLDRKNYGYKCREEPICSRCDRTTCKTRKFGVGSGDDDDEVPQLSALTKFDTDPPTFFLDVEGKRLGPLETDDILVQPRFQRKCAERISLVPPIVRPHKWRKLLQSLFDDISVVEMPEEASAEGQLWQHLEHFCVNRSASESRDEILMGRTWTDPQVNRTFFRMRDFVAYLERIRFREYRTHQITAILRKRGAETSGAKIKRKFVNLWSVRSFEQDDEPLEPLDSGEDLL